MVSQGFKCHRGFLGGDKRYYNMFLLQKFFKEVFFRLILQSRTPQATSNPKVVKTV